MLPTVSAGVVAAPSITESPIAVTAHSVSLGAGVEAPACGARCLGRGVGASDRGSRCSGGAVALASGPAGWLRWRSRRRRRRCFTVTPGSGRGDRPRSAVGTGVGAGVGVGPQRSSLGALRGLGESRPSDEPEWPSAAVQASMRS
jgi:hypothetical protein